MGEMWKELSEDEKQQYTDEANTDKDRYKEAMTSYQPPDGSDEESEVSQSPTIGLVSW